MPKVHATIPGIQQFNSRQSVSQHNAYRPIPIIINESLLRRFWKYTEPKDGCWKWSGAKFNKGYGCLAGFDPKRHNYMAHRVSWVVHFGEIPSGMVVCHKCDNPECTNPDHLFLGTLTENARDMISKGRGNLRRQDFNGERNGNARLSNQEAKEVREARDRGLSYEDIAVQFGVDQSTVGRIVRGETYRVTGGTK